MDARTHKMLFEAKIRKDWEEVESLARGWLREEPSDIFSIQELGQALEMQGQVDEAVQHYEWALEVDRREKSEFAHTYFLKRLDIIYHRNARYNDCLRICEHYVERHPKSWDPWNRLKRAAQKTGNTQLSKHASKRADEIKAETKVRRARPKRRPKPFKPQGEPIDLDDLAQITAEDVERANRRFDREYAEDYPLLAGLLKAKVTKSAEEEGENSPDSC